jgi:UDP-glucuronate 4-epimerase
MLSDGVAIPMYGDGSTQRDYTYVGDVMSGLAGARRYAHRHSDSFEIFNLGQGRTITLSEMIQILGDEMGIAPNVTRLADQPGDVERTHANVVKASSLLGYRPCVSFRDGIRSFVDWYRGEERP